MIKTLYIKDKITKNPCLSSNAYLAYLGILLKLKKDEVEYFARSDELSYLLTRKYPPIRQIMNSIDDGIVELAENDLIIISQSDRPHEWIIDTSIMKIDDDKEVNKYYTTIDKESIQKILLQNEAYYSRSISLVKFYVYVLSTIFKKKESNKGVGFTSVTNMSLEYGVNAKTVSSYLKQLEDLELIYIYRAKDLIKFDSGEIVEISHTYGKFENKDKIIKIGKQHEEQYGVKVKAAYKKIQKQAGDNTRIASHKYKHMVSCVDDNKEIPYTYDECKEIYLAMVDYNKRYEFRKERIKDLSIFSVFDFYDGQ